MDRNEIIATIKNLANTQGFYGRLYMALVELMAEKPRRYNAIMNTLEAEHFNDAIELVLYFECR